jgi:Subtilase family/Fervidolysin N-terminal prodomain
MMIFRRTSIIFIVLLVLAFFSGDRGHTQSIKINGEYVEGELLIRFSSEAARAKTIGRYSLERVREFSGLGWEEVRLPSRLSVAEAMPLFRRVPEVAGVQPNFVYRAQVNPNDPSFAELYGLNKIQAPAVWNTTTGSASVVVAVIDLGVDYNHEDLNANMWRNPGESGLDSLGRDKATNGVDDDGNGYIDDLFGIDTINHDSDPMDDHFHGTHVAGIIGAVGNNSKGVVGVNWTVRIMAIKSHDASGNGTSASVIEAFRYATLMRSRGINVRVTNSSWGGAPEAPSFDQALKDAIDAAGNAGILNVCAAGNSGTDNDITPFYPASYDSPSIVAVTASDRDDGAVFSYGLTSVDLAAPGVGILSTIPNSSYGPLTGTSMATPHVSGAAALLGAYNAYLTVSQLKSALLNNVDVLPAWTGKTVTGGRLNLLRALQSIPTTNPIDDSRFFVRQHYLDFLGREPDPRGLDFWTNEITRCGTNQSCIRDRRIGVSAAFFIETEFQQIGSFVIRLYRAAFDRRPSFTEFTTDRGLLVGGQTPVAFAESWVARDAFKLAFPLTMTNAEYVNRLFDTAHLIPFTAERQQQIDAMNQGRTREEVLRAVIDIQVFKDREYNPAFVLMQYFGYLKREPDLGGLLFWQDILNNREPNNYRSMVCAFLTSQEYQVRFAPVVSRTNAECGQ